MKKNIRKILPPALRAIRRNCGGINRSKAFFGAQLLEDNIDQRHYLKIVNALIFSNGVRKSTRFNRNAPVLQQLLATQQLHWVTPSISVLDAGASVGIDALGNLEVLEKYYDVKSYVLGDLYTQIIFDPIQNIVFDQDGKAIQVMFADYFVALHFEFKYWIEPLFHLRNLWITHRLRKRYSDVLPSEGSVKVALVYPATETHPGIEVRRLNVFEPSEDKYDLIICMNLLQRRYFSAERVEKGNENLRRSLNPGGFLITGVTDDYRIIGSK